jgi:dolichyl-phosphate-mannose--protein O-mannosyl transferase
VKAYVISTGALFGLLTVAHLWRMISAEPEMARDPWYILITVAAAALCFWALSLLRRSSRP